VYVAGDGALLEVAETIAADWAALGMRGSFLARRLDTGDQLGFDVETPVPLASVVKVPLALVVLDRIAAGRPARRGAARDRGPGDEQRRTHRAGGVPAPGHRGRR